MSSADEALWVEAWIYLSPLWRSNRHTHQGEPHTIPPKLRQCLCSSDCSVFFNHLDFFPPPVQTPAPTHLHPPKHVCIIVNFGYFFIESSAITTTGTTTTGSTAGNWLQICLIPQHILCLYLSADLISPRHAIIKTCQHGYCVYVTRSLNTHAVR